MNSFISRLGGKSRLKKKIIPLIPEHENYIEVFAGAAWIMFGKEPSKNEIINDIDSELINLYKIVRVHPDEFIRLVNFELHSREAFCRYKAMNPRYLTDIERAVRFYYMIKVSFSSQMRSWAPSLNGSPKFNKKNLQDTIIRVSARLNKVEIENLDFKRLIPKYNRPESFYYVDPPYYEHENDYGKGIFSIQDHTELRDLLRDLKGKFLVSYNNHPVIRELYKDYNIIEVETNYSVFKNKYKAVTELIITNY